MKTFIYSKPVSIFVATMSFVLFSGAVGKGASSSYSVELKGPIPLVVGKPCPIIGSVTVKGSPAKNLSLGVDDGVGQRCIQVKTDSSGKFSFTTVPSKEGKAQLKFLFGTPSKQCVSSSVSVFGSVGSLFKSTSSPGPYLDYYRINVCDQSNPSVTCRTEGGNIYCGLGKSTMSFCGTNRYLPKGNTVISTYSALTNRTTKLTRDQCFSSCYMQKRDISFAAVAPICCVVVGGGRARPWSCHGISSAQS